MAVIVFDPATSGVDMTTAAQILHAKPDSAVYTTTPDASVFEAVREMARQNVGALIVM